MFHYVLFYHTPDTIMVSTRSITQDAGKGTSQLLNIILK